MVQSEPNLHLETLAAWLLIFLGFAISTG
uniref:Uncharacterized protein n=1 Tax=Rhizophora mucronata TaxID=61149 RepID=A0A2P2Q6P2_RHIMU